MYYVETWNIPGDLNMAIDVAMGEISYKLNSPILRIYTWEKPTLSLGRNQKISDVDFNSLKKYDISCVRRPSGGRAVLHWDEITYAVVFPEGAEEFSMGVLKLYNKISDILKEAFENLGYGVVKSNGRGSLKNPSCFSSSAKYELFIDGKKFVGSAQARFKKFVLQHGSIMLIPHWEILNKILKTKVNVDHKKLATGLFEVKKVPVRDIIERVKESFSKRYGLVQYNFYKTLAMIRQAEKNRGSYSCQNCI
ncbi:MAG: lipoate--protein ligase family protein [Thermotogaceae bacterium]|nr:lipoate--protein ligase family protein [Thermotogaceae bacterium]